MIAAAVTAIETTVEAVAAPVAALGSLAGLAVAVARAYRWQTSRMERISDDGWRRAAEAEQDRDRWRDTAERLRLRAVRAEAALTAAGIPIPEDRNGH